MLLGFLTIVIMVLVAYVYLREGLFTAAAMCCNVLGAGFVAFNFWEPLANLLDPPLSGTFLRGFEDFLCLIAIFALTLGLMRAATNALAFKQIQFPDALQRPGGLVFGLATGYFVAGFLLCAMQTLPWHQNFMAFDAQYDPGPESTIRQVLPPDRVWLGMMYRAGAIPFATSDLDDRYPTATSEKHFTFDKFGTFELRYARHRRWDNNGLVLPYQGEFQEQLRGPR